MIRAVKARVWYDWLVPNQVIKAMAVIQGLIRARG
jgi:hypothetical protein